MLWRLERTSPYRRCRAPIPKGVDPESITLEQAVKLLEATIPQSLGTHPEDGAPVFVKTGRWAAVPGKAGRWWASDCASGVRVSRRVAVFVAVLERAQAYCTLDGTCWGGGGGLGAP